jgi:hypothetical protein
MPEAKEERLALAQLAYENAGREITQVFDVMNSNTSLAAGVLAALLAVLGAGELFAQGEEIAQRGETFPRLSAVSLVVLAAAAPLIVRFFIRSMTAYQNLIRFLDIQNRAWSYLTGRLGWEAFDFHVELYWTRWKTPKAMKTIVLSNLKYGFMWIAAVTVLALGWAFWSVDNLWARLAAAGLLVVGLGWEGITLLGYRQRYYQLPDKLDLDRLQELMASGSSLQVSGKSRPGDLLEEASGVFLGKRRLFRRRH